MCRADIANRARDAALRRLLSRAEIARAADENARDTRQMYLEIVERHLISYSWKTYTPRRIVAVCRFLRLSEKPANYDTLGFVIFLLYPVTDIFFLFAEEKTAFKVSGLCHNYVIVFYHLTITFNYLLYYIWTNL